MVWRADPPDTIELDGAVVLIGPNNSGKTSAMQALALWDIGLRRWLERRPGARGRRRRPRGTDRSRGRLALRARVRLREPGVLLLPAATAGTRAGAELMAPLFEVYARRLGQ